MLAPFIAAVDAHDGYYKFEAPGFMPLSFEYIGVSDYAGRPIYAMAHYGEQNGDLMADPDMEIAVDKVDGKIYPRTFQNDYIGLFQRVFKEVETVSGYKTVYSPSLLRDLDHFLWQWCNNLDMQGFKAA